MIFALPKEDKPCIPLPHFPTRHQAFIFRAYEFFSIEKIAEILETTPENVENAAKEMGIPEFQNKNLWADKGYITIIRRMWHILPYSQLIKLLETDENSLAVILREEDFLDIKLSNKPVCEPVIWRELTKEEKEETAKIKQILAGIDISGKKPFEFEFPMPSIKFSGKELFETRMIYTFSGLYLKAFDVDSTVYCSDEMLKAYANLGINAVWAQAVLFQITEFPFEPSISKGYEKRLENMRNFTERLEKFGIKLFLYLNEPRSMPESFYEKYPHLKGHKQSDENVCMCTSSDEVKDYIKNGVEAVCRAVPKLGGFFTISRSENLTNCYSVAGGYETNCPVCKDRDPAEVIAEVNACIAEGAHRVNKDIKVMAWSWGWNEKSLDIIKNLPKDIILLSQSELHIPFNIGGVKDKVIDYSMSIVGPGENAKKEWQTARENSLETAAKVQICTTWEAPTAPAIPVYPKIEEHMKNLQKEGVKHLLASWTLGGYPSLNIQYAAKYFYEKCEMPSLSENLNKAVNIFSEAFSEFPFNVYALYFGPFGAGPSSMLFLDKTGYSSTMTCFAYDDIDNWRGIYPLETYISQLTKLCKIWKTGLDLIENEPDGETKIMAEAVYCLYKSSLNQTLFYKARQENDKQTMLKLAESETEITKLMLSLMNKNAAIGYEAANHYYFSKGQLVEKIINCNYVIEKLK